MFDYNNEYVVRLPIETLSGESAYAEGSHTGKKKEAVVLCALEACRLLDAEGILRESMTSKEMYALCCQYK